MSRLYDRLGRAASEMPGAAVVSNWVLFMALQSACFGLPCLSYGTASARASDLATIGSLNQVAVGCELKTVKLFGAGGVAGLDAFQSGFFISAEGHILTVWSTVLDVDEVIAVASDGNRLEATVLGIDPNLEIAVLATGQPASNYFDLKNAKEVNVGERVLAFSNLYKIATGNEMASIQQGVVMAKTELKARRGSFESVYQGPVYIIDAMTNNPGAAGGTLTDLDGQLLGMLGKELRDSQANIWLNYALPIAAVRDSVERIIAGKAILRTENRQIADRPANLADMGIVLVPDVLAKTPSFVDMVKPDSMAGKAGLARDDLILFINSMRVTSQQALRNELQYIDRLDEIILLVQRGNELKEIILSK